MLVTPASYLLLLRGINSVSWNIITCSHHIKYYHLITSHHHVNCRSKNHRSILDVWQGSKHASVRGTKKAAGYAYYLKNFGFHTAWKVSVFGVILVRIQSECVGNTDQNNSQHGHFSRSVKLRDKIFLRKFCRQNIMKKFHVSLDISMSGGRLHTPQSLMNQGFRKW